MPSKLETYEKEQERLRNKKNLTASDERRLADLARLIRQAKSDPELVGRGVVAAARRTLSGPWVEGDSKKKAVRIADAAISPYGASARTKAKRDVIRQQMGLKPLVQSEFMVPVTDPDTDALLGFETSPEFEGYRFGPQSSGPAKGPWNAAGFAGRGATRAGLASNASSGLTMMTGMSVKDVMEFYASLKGDELVKVQQDLMDAGLYGDRKPRLGFRDDATTMALTDLMRIWAGADGGLPEVLSMLKQEANSMMSETIRERSGIGVVSDTIANISVTDATTLDALIDQVSQELFGSNIDKGRKQELIGRLQEQEKSYKTSAVTSEFEAGKAQKDAGGGKAGFDQFIDALIGQESGGDPNVVNADSGAMGIGQIMPENWGPWAAEAGVDPADFSAANQMRVIRYKVAKYYEQYGNWRDVAIAWYGGGSGVARAKAGGGFADEDGYPSLNAYADSVLAKMGSATASNLQGGGLRVNVTETLPDDRTRIAAELKAADPSRYYGTQWQRQAENFMSLLGGIR